MPLALFDEVNDKDASTNVQTPAQNSVLLDAFSSPRIR